MSRARIGMNRNGAWVGRYTLTWRDPWTRKVGLALDDGNRAVFVVRLRSSA
jgi:hypothetical protein